MTYAQLTLPEFENEMNTTRKMLERVPEDELMISSAWRLHRIDATQADMESSTLQPRRRLHAPE